MSVRACSQVSLEVFSALLIGMSTLILVGCGNKAESGREPQSKKINEEKAVESSEEEKQFPEYQLRTHWIDIHAGYAITINGFPIRQLKLKGRASDDEFNLSLNKALIGEGNRAELRFQPLILRGEKNISLGMVDVEATVLGPDGSPISGARITTAQVDSAYASWSERVRKKWKEYRTTVDQGALDSIRAWADRNPLTVSATFDNEAGADFSRIFEEAPRLEDTPATRERLRGYAMRLRDLMAQEDTSALLEEFRPAIEDRFEALSFSDREKFIQQNREALVLENPVLDFGREDIRLRAWCDGRVWQLIREGAKNDGLLQEPSGTGRGKIYVAEIDGELKVIRQG